MKRSKSILGLLVILLGFLFLTSSNPFLAALGAILFFVGLLAPLISRDSTVPDEQEEISYPDSESRERETPRIYPRREGVELFRSPVYAVALSFVFLGSCLILGITVGNSELLNPEMAQALARQEDARAYSAQMHAQIELEALKSLSAQEIQNLDIKKQEFETQQQLISLAGYATVATISLSVLMLLVAATYNLICRGRTKVLEQERLLAEVKKANNTVN